jgi:hypothetical protein
MERAGRQGIVSSDEVQWMATAQRKARRGRALPERLRVLSIDVGLRNLGLAVVNLVDSEQEAALIEQDRETPLGRREARKPGNDDDAAAGAGHVTDLPDIMSRRIFVEHAENVDVLEENGCTAKNAKAIGPLRQVTFWHGCMMKRVAVLLDPPPDIVVVEVQDGGNATMRQMSTGIVGLFMGHFEARHRDGNLPRVPAFTMIRGDMKMKICERIQAAWGEPPSPPPHAALPTESRVAAEAAGEAAAADLPPEPPAYLLKVNPRRYYAMQRAHKQAEADQAAPAAPAPSGSEDEVMATMNPAVRKRNSTGRSKAAYEMRKKMAVGSFELYMERLLTLAPHLLSRELRTNWKRYTLKKRRDVSDAVLQAIYVIARELKLV